MRKFEFKLQKLLEIRQKKEDQEKIELAKASGAYQFELNKKEKILNGLNNLRQELVKNKNKLLLENLKSYDRFIRNSDLAINKLNVVIEEKRQIMQEHIEKYAALKRDKKAVGVLKDKAVKRYEEEANKEEQKDTDEIGKNLYIKNKGAGINSEN